MFLAFLMSLPFCEGVCGVLTAFSGTVVKILDPTLQTGRVHRFVLSIFHRDRALALNDRLE
jgi:hypothetical protein